MNTMTLQHSAPADREKPENGVQGLKHWRYDLMAGLQVALVGLPLSLGIAVASGAPPITGVVSAIIGGLVYPFLGGSYVTISGPAAGLAPALLAGMLALGHGNLVEGYPFLLVAIFLTGLVQVLLSLLRAGKFAIFFPISVVEGMLAAIGLLIIVKMIPALTGVLAPPVESIPVAISQIPENFLHLTPTAFLIGVVSLILLFGFSKRTDRWSTLFPTPLLVTGAGILMGWLFQLPSTYLIQVPANILEHGIHPPDFFGMWERPDLWMSLLVVVVTLTLIDGTESLATIAGVDKIDPFKRKSDPNQTLKAMGVSNMLSSLAGGLTIIPGGMKSTTNIVAGGRTLWSNFYYALSMALILFIGTGLLSRIPLATLAALLIFVGWRLCEPRVFRNILTIGREQLLICVVTIAVTLYTSDLLIGVGIGTLTKFGVLCFRFVQFLLVETKSTPGDFSSVAHLLSDAFKEMFTDPVIRIGDARGSHERYSVKLVSNSVTGGPVGSRKNTFKIYLSSVTCMNLIKLDKALSKVPIPHKPGSDFVVIVRGLIIDHTAMEYLHHFQERCLHAGHTCTLVGMESFQALSDHALAFRMMNHQLQPAL
jgi:carbonic anhydrase